MGNVRQPRTGDQGLGLPWYSYVHVRPQHMLETLLSLLLHFYLQATLLGVTFIPCVLDVPPSVRYLPRSTYQLPYSVEEIDWEFGVYNFRTPNL